MEKSIHLVGKEEWLEICSKYNKWCSFEDIKGIPYDTAIKYIESMPTFSPQ